MADFSNLSDDMQRMLFRSLEQVGKGKAVGYLPLNTVENVLKTRVEFLIKKFVSEDVATKVFAKDQTCIKSGAIFFFSRRMIHQAVAVHKESLTAQERVLSPDELVDKLAQNWYDEDDPMMPLIKTLFDDVS